MRYVFLTLAYICGIYNFLCFIRIILTWIPQVSYSKPAQILAKIVDPYLNLFRKIRWLRMGSFDFSPALAICILGALQTLFQSLSAGGKISVGIVLSALIQIILSIFESFIIFMLILLIVRLIVLLVNKTQYATDPVMESIDRSINPMIYKMSRIFSFGHKLTYKTSLIICIIEFIVIEVVTSLLFGLIINALSGLPF